MDCELVMKLGQAGARVLTERCHKRPVILIGKDTRQSGDMLEAALCAGICSVGADAVRLGVLPTPAVAHLVRTGEADAGVVISASHNPMEHNGIKFFDRDGNKLPDELEDRIEALMNEPVSLVTGGSVGRVRYDATAKERYLDFLCSTMVGDLSGLNIAVDCANGAASATAKQLFERLGANAVIICDQPNGSNINDRCGSTHLAMLQELVAQGGFDAGVAFDGDADRCLFVDEKGLVVDGDRIIALCACDLMRRGLLHNNAVVVTVMSNLGFFEMAEKQGIEALTAKVGDRYVLELMREKQCNLGGEQSGHIIFLDYNATGDGQLTAVQTLAILKRSGKSISELAGVMTVYPQVLKNVKVRPEGKTMWPEDQKVAAAIRAAELQLGKNGRVLVRPSGTEPLVRVMLEGKEQDLIGRLCDEIAEALTQAFGLNE